MQLRPDVATAVHETFDHFLKGDHPSGEVPEPTNRTERFIHPLLVIARNLERSKFRWVIPVEGGLYTAAHGAQFMHPDDGGRKGSIFLQNGEREAGALRRIDLLDELPERPLSWTMRSENPFGIAAEMEGNGLYMVRVKRPADSSALSLSTGEMGLDDLPDSSARVVDEVIQHFAELAEAIRKMKKRTSFLVG